METHRWRDRREHRVCLEGNAGAAQRHPLREVEHLRSPQGRFRLGSEGENEFLVCPMSWLRLVSPSTCASSVASRVISGEIPRTPSRYHDAAKIEGPAWSDRGNRILLANRFQALHGLTDDPSQESAFTITSPPVFVFLLLRLHLHLLHPFRPQQQLPYLKSSLFITQLFVFSSVVNWTIRTPSRLSSSKTSESSSRSSTGPASNRPSFLSRFPVAAPLFSFVSLHPQGFPKEPTSAAAVFSIDAAQNHPLLRLVVHSMATKPPSS